MKVFLLLIGVFQMAVGCSGGPPNSDVGVCLSQPSNFGSSGGPPNSDAGLCLSQPSNFAPCDVDQQTCMGPVACRSCNGALRLWALRAAWSCGCATGTLNGRTGLYWQCALPPVCIPGPNTFTDSQCTVAACD